MYYYYYLGSVEALIGGRGRGTQETGQATQTWARARWALPGSPSWSRSPRCAPSQPEGALSLFMSLTAPFLELMPLTLPWYHRFRYHHLQEAFPDAFPWFPH